MADDDRAGWLESIAEGGVLQLAIGRHAADAIGQLIFGASQIGVAYLKGLAQPIHDRVDGASLIRRRLAEAAAELGVSDPALVERTLHRLAKTETTKQQNREAIARLAVEDLEADPPKAEAPVGDDFMSRFEQFAEGATSPDMQVLFARVLAGEIRKPGAFSLAALHVLSIMDRALAEQLQRASSWVFNGAGIPAGGAFLGGEIGEVIGNLVDLGLARAIHMTQTLPARNGDVTIETRDRLFILTLGGDSSATHFPYWLLTRTGREILSIVPITPVTEEDLRLLHDAWSLAERVARVRSGPLMSDPATGKPATPIGLLIEF